MIYVKVRHTKEYVFLQGEIMKNYKLLMLLLVMNITFQILSDMTAGKIVDFFGFGVAVTVIYFPFVYIVSDIVAEVYGYTVAKRMSQYTLLACVIEVR